MKRCAIALALAGWLGVPACLLAQDKDSAGDAAAIRQSAEAFAKAYNEANAKAIAAEFLPDGEFIDEEGTIFKGRDAIEKEFAAYFEQSPGAKAEIEVTGVRFVGTTMAIEEGVTTVVPSEDSPATDSPYVAVHIKQDGKWQIGVARDLESKVVSPHEHLLGLSWLIGDWIDKSEESVVKTSFRWSEDGNYVLSDFEVEIPGLARIKGNQRIGWDPARKQIRSWLFDSEGGFGEATWTQVGDDWLIRLNAVRSDGSAAAATNLYQPAGPDAYVWTTRDRVVDGELQPDVAVSVVRKPPEPQTANASQGKKP